MSVDDSYTARAWSADLEGLWKLVLLALARDADLSGRRSVRLSLAELAAVCGVHPRTVRRVLYGLEEGGLLVRSGRHGLQLGMEIVTHSHKANSDPQSQNTDDSGNFVTHSHSSDSQSQTPSKVERVGEEQTLTLTSFAPESERAPRPLSAPQRRVQEVLAAWGESPEPPEPSLVGKWLKGRTVEQVNAVVAVLRRKGRLSVPSVCAHFFGRRRGATRQTSPRRRSLAALEVVE